MSINVGGLRQDTGDGESDALSPGISDGFARTCAVAPIDVEPNPRQVERVVKAKQLGKIKTANAVLRSLVSGSINSAAVDETQHIEGCRFESVLSSLENEDESPNPAEQANHSANSSCLEDCNIPQEPVDKKLVNMIKYGDGHPDVERKPVIPDRCLSTGTTQLLAKQKLSESGQDACIASNNPVKVEKMSLSQKTALCVQLKRKRRKASSFDKADTNINAADTSSAMLALVTGATANKDAIKHSDQLQDLQQSPFPVHPAGNSPTAVILDANIFDCFGDFPEINDDDMLFDFFEDHTVANSTNSK